MPNLLVWTVGDLMPSISDTLTINGAPFNLSASTAVFKMRLAGSSTLKVHSNAVVVSPANLGGVRYDWQVADVDTAGDYICWWEITTGGAVQSVNESIIQFRDHVPIDGYVELEQLKSTLSLSGLTWTNPELQSAVIAASRSIDEQCGRFFYQSTGVRYYDPATQDLVITDDMVTVTEVAIDLSGNESYSTVLDTSTYDLGPYNNPSVDRPYEWLRRRWNLGQSWWPTLYPRSVRVTGTFGWPKVPGPIQTATTMLAHRYFRRMREAPFAIVSVGLTEGHALMRISQTDPDVYALITGYIRRRPFI